MSNSPQRRVVCAANRLRDQPHRIICSARHFDPLMRAQIAACEGSAVWKTSEQGFIDQWGVWMDREEAMLVARAAGQVVRPNYGASRGCGPRLDDPQLYSEDLY